MAAVMAMSALVSKRERGVVGIIFVQHITRVFFYWIDHRRRGDRREDSRPFDFDPRDFDARRDLEPPFDELTRDDRGDIDSASDSES